MQRPKLSRAELIEILHSDQWLRRSLAPKMDRSWNHDLHVRLTQLWERVEKELTEAAAERLLGPQPEGSLLSLEQVRERAIAMARTLGTFEIPRAPEPYRNALAEPAVDFILSLHECDIDQTPTGQWDRVSAIHQLAKSYGMAPLKFMSTIPGAEDWVTRLTMTPTTYREQVLARVDARHPDRVRESVLRFAKSASLQFGDPEFQRVYKMLMSRIPQGDGYWRYRATWITQVEQEIRHLWPGYDEEHLTEEDA